MFSRLECTDVADMSTRFHSFSGDTVDWYKLSRWCTTILSVTMLVARVLGRMHVWVILSTRISSFTGMLLI
jgi:hypothetical protein